MTDTHETDADARAERESPSAFMIGALVLIAIVWLGAAVFNFEEQTGLARTKGFRVPELLPLMLDGLAISLATIGFAASLDGRAALFPRFGTGLALAMSALCSGYAAYDRTYGIIPTPDRFTREGADLGTVVIGAGTPLIVMVAFEALLVEVRRIVQKWRGRKSPTPIPAPRLIAWALDPVHTFATFRRNTIEICRAELQLTAAEPPKPEPVRVTVLPPTPATQLPEVPRAITTEVSEETTTIRRVRRTDSGSPEERLDAAIAERLDAARSVVDRLAGGDPQKITTTALRTELRTSGVPTPNDVAGPLHARLKELASTREEIVE